MEVRPVQLMVRVAPERPRSQQLSFAFSSEETGP